MFPGTAGIPAFQVLAFPGIPVCQVIVVIPEHLAIAVTLEPLVPAEHPVIPVAADIPATIQVRRVYPGTLEQTVLLV